MRAQVTGFAIVGVLILVGVLALVWVSRAPNTQPEPQRPSLDLEACIEDVSLEAIGAVGLAGGVHPDDALDPIGIARFGLEDNHHVWPALVAWDYGNGPAYIPGERHVFEPSMRTAANVFPAFSRTSTAITSLIEENAQDCETVLSEGDIDVISTEYSDTNVRVESRVSEQGRSPRDVTVTVPVPIRSYHRALRAAIQKDNQELDPEFRFSSLATDGFSLTTIPTNTGENHTILLLRSDRPLVGSEAFMFLTLIEERAPVFIGEAPDGCTGTTPTFSSGVSLEDVYVDPDDDHEPTASCTTDTAFGLTTITYSLESGGQTYEFEVTT